MVRHQCPIGTGCTNKDRVTCTLEYPWNIWDLWLCRSLLDPWNIWRHRIPETRDHGFNLHGVGEMIQRDPSNVWNLPVSTSELRSSAWGIISSRFLANVFVKQWPIIYENCYPKIDDHLCLSNCKTIATSFGNQNLTHAYLGKHFFNLKICRSRILFPASGPCPSGAPHQQKVIAAANME